MKKLISTIALLLASIEIAAAPLTYTANLQWTYPSTNFQFKVYAALGTNVFSLLGIVTNKTSTITSNIPANVDNRFYVTALDTKTGLESDPSNVVTNRVNIVKPQAITNLTITVTIP